MSPEAWAGEEPRPAGTCTPWEPCSTSCAPARALPPRAVRRAARDGPARGRAPRCAEAAPGVDAALRGRGGALPAARTRSSATPRPRRCWTRWSRWAPRRDAPAPSPRATPTAACSAFEAEHRAALLRPPARVRAVLERLRAASPSCSSPATRAWASPRCVRRACCPRSPRGPWRTGGAGESGGWCRAAARRPRSPPRSLPCWAGGGRRVAGGAVRRRSPTALARRLRASAGQHTRAGRSMWISWRSWSR